MYSSQEISLVSFKIEELFYSGFSVDEDHAMMIGCENRPQCRQWASLRLTDETLITIHRPASPLQDHSAGTFHLLQRLSFTFHLQIADFRRCPSPASETAIAATHSPLDKFR